MSSFTSQSMPCPSCGQRINATDRACARCGMPLGMLNQKDPYLGKSIDNTFEIVSILGEGNMGVVYKARHRTLDRFVAIKILRRDLVSDAGLVARFQHEAQAVSSIMHPNVIRIQHYGKTHLDVPYMVMEYLNGTELSTVIEENFPLPPLRCCNILMQIARALEAAHRARIIHRDLKPANITLITQNNGTDLVKVLDFGIAKIQNSEVRGLTGSGTILGTPAYMSPEQITGLPVTPATDIFSFGTLMYYMLTKILPFQGNNPTDIAYSILSHVPPSPSKARLDTLIPEILSDICMRALQKNPEERFKSAEELRITLEQASEFLKVSTPVIRSKGKKGIIVGDVGSMKEVHAGETVCELPAVTPEIEAMMDNDASISDIRYSATDNPVVKFKSNSSFTFFHAIAFFSAVLFIAFLVILYIFLFDNNKVGSGSPALAADTAENSASVDTDTASIDPDTDLLGFLRVDPIVLSDELFKASIQALAPLALYPTFDENSDKSSNSRPKPKVNSGTQKQESKGGQNTKVTDNSKGSSHPNIAGSKARPQKKTPPGKKTAPDRKTKAK